eukprot:357523-Chlamydomonas_euryale.AAC.2
MRACAGAQEPRVHACRNVSMYAAVCHACLNMLHACSAATVQHACVILRYTKSCVDHHGRCGPWKRACPAQDVHDNMAWWPQAWLRPPHKL